MPASEPPPAPFGTNDVSDGGRAFVLMIDDESLRTGQEPPLRDAVSHFLTGLTSRDRVAVITVPHGNLRCDFTNDRSKVRQAMSQITGHYNERETGMEIATRTRTTLQTVAGWMENLGGGQGPTTVVLFSLSLMGVRGNITPIRSIAAARGVGTPGDTIGGNQIRQGRIHAASATPPAAARAVLRRAARLGGRVQAAAAASDDSTRAGLENIRASRAAGSCPSPAPATTRRPRGFPRDLAHWAATFDAEANERNQRAASAERERSRDGVIDPACVRRCRLASRRPTRCGSSATNPHAMLGKRACSRELPMRRRLQGRATRDGQIKVVVVAETVDSNMTFAAAEAGLFDDTGRLLKQWAPSPTELGPAVSSARFPASAGHLPAARRRRRLGQRGSADVDVRRTWQSRAPG